MRDFGQEITRIKYPSALPITTKTEIQPKIKKDEETTNDFRKMKKEQIILKNHCLLDVAERTKDFRKNRRF